MKTFYQWVETLSTPDERIKAMIDAYKRGSSFHPPRPIPLTPEEEKDKDLYNQQLIARQKRQLKRGTVDVQ